MKYCNKCGAELNDDAIFCKKCGTKTMTTESTKEVVEEAKTNDVYEAKYFYASIGGVILLICKWLGDYSTIFQGGLFAEGIFRIFLIIITTISIIGIIIAGLTKADDFMGISLFGVALSYGMTFVNGTIISCTEPELGTSFFIPYTVPHIFQTIAFVILGILFLKKKSTETLTYRGARNWYVPFIILIVAWVYEFVAHMLFFTDTATWYIFVYQLFIEFDSCIYTAIAALLIGLAIKERS